MAGIKSSVCDLSQLSGPLSIERVVRVIKKHFHHQNYMFSIGSVLISTNPFTEPLLPGFLIDSATDGHECLRDILYQALNKLRQTYEDQVIVLSGESGSGKTYHLYRLMKNLYEATGGGTGTHTDLYKHVCATFTVLQPLCTASTTLNRTSSRVGLFIQNFMTRGVVCRTKLNCFFLDHGRVCTRRINDSNYSVFYLMLTGMAQDERVKYCLLGYNSRNLRYLRDEAITNMPSVEIIKDRFVEWKHNLCILEISVSDVLRTLSAALLLGNVRFLQSQHRPEIQLHDSQALYAVSDLLGISPTSLYMALSTHLSVVKGVTLNRQRTPSQAEHVCDSLAKALYARTVMSVIGKANSFCKMSHKITKPDSTLENKHDSHPGTEASISVVDMCGFENLQDNRFTQLCVNLSAETMQYYYNTQVLRTVLEASNQQAIQPNLAIDYFDNAAIIELIATKRTGILSMLNAECSSGNSSQQAFLTKLWSRHDTGNSFFEAISRNPNSFLIHHFAGSVEYNSSDFISTNQDIIPAELINLFNERDCSCGFVKYLFPSEKQKLQKSMPKTSNKTHSILHRLEHQRSMPGGHGTIAEAHRHQLNRLIKVLMHLQPHFIICIKSNADQRVDYFDNDVVFRQISSLQIMPTLKLFTAGLPHKLRYKYFLARYQCLTYKGKKLPPSYTCADQCEELLDVFLTLLDETSLSYSNILWTLGPKHIFLSEDCYRHLEVMRDERWGMAAQCIQTSWKMYAKVKDEYIRHKTLIVEANDNKKCSKRISPITAVRPFPEHILNTCKHFGLISSQLAPSIPPPRMYSIVNDCKLSFPQERILRQSYKDISGTVPRGQAVTVIGPSSRPEHMLVDLNGQRISIPHKMLIIQNQFHHAGIT